MLVSLVRPTGQVAGFNTDRISTFLYNPQFTLGVNLEPVSLLGITLDTDEQVTVQGPIAEKVLATITGGQAGVLVGRSHGFNLTDADTVDITQNWTL